MDDDADLIARLCTRAGMIMEDTSFLAVTMVGLSDLERTERLHRIAHASHAVDTLVAAANALNHHLRGVSAS
jgi:hypothetical protein